jgi:transposase-like protein
VFGLLEVHHSSRRLVLKLVPSRARTTLIPIIKRHVRSGSTIYSDSWRAYVQSLTTERYHHYPVNHKNNFVDPQTGSHTQHIERYWQTIKGQVWRLRGNRTEKILKSHLKFIEWTYWLGKKTKKGIFGRLIHDISQKYRV